MRGARVIAVASASAAERAGVVAGDELVALNGQVPRDVIQYQLLVDSTELTLAVNRGGVEIEIDIERPIGEPLGIEVESALFDQVRTCDNHCEFCFIYQLPKGLRKSLYLKDDDYRLSFLYGNFTTLTRFTESDLERVVTEDLSPLHVSLHAADPDVRSELLKNRRGATSLRWLRILLDHGIEVHGQIVVCPGINDGAVLEDTLVGVADRYPDLASLCVVPLGVSRFVRSDRMRPHTRAEATTVIDVVERWQARFLELFGRRLVFAADEYYLLARREFPLAATYEGFPMHEDGIGMARSLEQEFRGEVEEPVESAGGFFAWVDGAPAEGYRADRSAIGSTVAVQLGARRDAPVGVLTGSLGAEVLAPLLAEIERDDVRLIPVENRFFGGTIGVTGLLVGEDLARVLHDEPVGHRYLLPDVCLSGDRFLDGRSVDDLPRPVEVVATNGFGLREALGG